MQVSKVHTSLTSFKWFLFRCENFLCDLEKVTIDTASVEEGECRTIQDCWNKGSCYYITNVNPW